MIAIIPNKGGELRFLQKIKFPANVILMLGTFRYVLSHIKYKISFKKNTRMVIVFLDTVYVHVISLVTGLVTD